MAVQRHPTIHKADARAQRVRQRKTHAVCRSLPNTDAAMRTDAHARRVTRPTLPARRKLRLAAHPVAGAVFKLFNVAAWSDRRAILFKKK